MSLSIKEAFRYQNFLDKNLSSLLSTLGNKSNALKVEEIHYKSKSNSEALDETVDQTAERTYPNATVVDLSFLVKQLVNQKLKLSLAIENAKRDLFLEWKEDGQSLTLDTAVEFAKKNREQANTLKYLVDLKASEKKSQASSYKFNVAGDQVLYKYDVSQTTTLDFDKNIINDMYKKLLNVADTLSTQIELAMLKEIVDFVPLYNIHDSIVDVVDKYIANK